jgi:hypothetical protein
MVNITTEIKIEIEWSYTPPDYFEEKVVWKREGYSVEIEDGRITARMSGHFFDSQPGLRDSLTEQLRIYFLGAQPNRHRAFEIHGGAINRIWPNGRRDTTLVVHSAVQVMTSDNVDIATTDREGVVHDTRRDRINATKNLAQLSVRHAVTDQTIRRMLDSFDAAVRYPGNELVYLYEVWDALRTKFRSESKALKALRISKPHRSRLTRLANNKPLNQGRHRGQFAGSLRDATTEELNEARAIARDMVKQYLKYLDEQQQPK